MYMHMYMYMYMYMDGWMDVCMDVCMYVINVCMYGMEWNGMECKVMYVCIRRHVQTQRSMVCAGCFLF